MAFSLPLHAQNVQKEVAAKIAKKLIQNVRGETGEVFWSAHVGPAFSEIVTLETTQAIREAEKALYRETLADMRANLLRRFTNPMTVEVVRDGENAALFGSQFSNFLPRFPTFFV